MTDHSTNGERALDVTDKVTTLYGLVVVEMAGARRQMNNSPNWQYGSGRAGGYKFVLDAMEMRWPELREFRKVYAEGLDEP